MLERSQIGTQGTCFKNSSSSCLPLDFSQTKPSVGKSIYEIYLNNFLCHLLLWMWDSPWALLKLSLGLEIFIQLKTGKLKPHLKCSNKIKIIPFSLVA